MMPCCKKSVIQYVCTILRPNRTIFVLNTQLMAPKHMETLLDSLRYVRLHVCMFVCVLHVCMRVFLCVAYV